MKSLSIWILTLCLIAGAAGLVLASDGEEMSEEEMMKAWMEAAAPGPAHEKLARMAGEWTYTTTSFEGPEPAVVSTGTAVKTMTLGGRYLRDENEGESFGMPFHGIGLTGYNNTTGQYEWIWYDNMSTAIMYGTGVMDGNTLACTLDYIDPITKKSAKARTAITIESDDRHVFSWYNVDGDEAVKAMEVEYVRK